MTKTSYFPSACKTKMSIPLFKVFVAEDAAAKVGETLQSGTLTQGPKVAELERRLTEFCGFEKVLTLNSATSGLFLALKLLEEPDLDDGWPGWLAGDEVLTPSLTCTATNFPMLHLGLQPKWVDCDSNSCNVSLEDIKAKLTARTKIVQVVHFGGTAIDVEELSAIVDEAKERLGFRPMIIEDCAHAFGARYPRSGNLVGSSGNICVFSFQAIKLLTCSDGAAITLPTEQLYQKCKLLRWFGIDREKRSTGGDFRLEGDIPEPGFKFHMNDYCATLGLANIDHIKDLLRKNRENAAFLHDELRDITPLLNYDIHSSFWLFLIAVNDTMAFLMFMKEAGIVCSQVHKRNDVHSCVSAYKVELPNLDALEKKFVAIPCGWWLSEDDLTYIVTKTKDYVNSS